MYFASIGKGRKHCGKWRKCWLLTFSLQFPYNVFKKLLFPDCLKLGLWGKELILVVCLGKKIILNKRAMMALDCSPEPFSLQMNYTSLFLWFQLVTPRVGPVLIPRGIMWIKLTKVYKEMLHTKNLSSISSSFREEKFWSWSSLFLCSNLWPQGWDQFWPERNHMNKIDKGPKRDDKYQISKL